MERCVSIVTLVICIWSCILSHIGGQDLQGPEPLAVSSTCGARLKLSASSDFHPCQYSPTSYVLTCSNLGLCEVPEFAPEDTPATTGKPIRFLEINFNRITILDAALLSVPALSQLREFKMEKNTIPTGETFQIANSLRLPDLMYFRVQVALPQSTEAEEVEKWPASDLSILFPAGGVPNLVKLEMDSVNVANIKRALELPGLTTLIWRNVHVSSLAKDTFSKMTFLKKLILIQLGTTNTALTSVPVPWSNTLDQVEVLDLSSNRLISPPTAFLTLFSSLKELYLRSNILESFSPTDIPYAVSRTLEILNLDQNGLLLSTQLSGLRSILGLKHLSMRDCSNLASVPKEVHNIARLESLVLDGSGISELSLAATLPTTGSLKVMSLENMVTSKYLTIQLDNAESVLAGLTVFRLSHVEGFNFDSSSGTASPTWWRFLHLMPRLEVLALRKMKLDDEFITRELPPSRSLQDLSLSQNSLSQIPRNASKLWPNLQNLSLDDNPLSAFPTELLDEWHQLKRIRLSATKLTILSNCSQTLWDSPSMLFMTDTSNWLCDCRLAWLQKLWLLQPESQRPTKVLCSQSGPFPGQSLFTVDFTAAGCKANEAETKCSYLQDYPRAQLELRMTNSTHIATVLTVLRDSSNSLPEGYFFTFTLLSDHRTANSSFIPMNQLQSVLNLQELFGKKDLFTSNPFIILNTCLTWRLASAPSECWDFTLTNPFEVKQATMLWLWIVLGVLGCLVLLALTGYCLWRCLCRSKNNDFYLKADPMGPEDGNLMHEYPPSYRFSRRPPTELFDNPDEYVSRHNSTGGGNWTSSLPQDGVNQQVFVRRTTQPELYPVDSNTWNPGTLPAAIQHQSLTNLMHQNSTVSAYNANYFTGRTPQRGGISVFRRNDAAGATLNNPYNINSTNKRMNRLAQSCENMRKSRALKVKSEADLLASDKEHQKMRGSALSLTSMTSQSVEERGPLPCPPPAEDPYEEIHSPKVDISTANRRPPREDALDQEGYVVTDERDHPPSNGYMAMNSLVNEKPPPKPPRSSHNPYLNYNNSSSLDAASTINGSYSLPESSRATHYIYP